MAFTCPLASTNREGVVSLSVLTAQSCDCVLVSSVPHTTHSRTLSNKQASFFPLLAFFIHVGAHGIYSLSSPYSRLEPFSHDSCHGHSTPNHTTEMFIFTLLRKPTVYVLRRYVPPSFDTTLSSNLLSLRIMSMATLPPYHALVILMRRQFLRFTSPYLPSTLGRLHANRADKGTCGPRCDVVDVAIDSVDLDWLHG
jgi:hypothetical protein